ADEQVVDLTAAVIVAPAGLSGPGKKAGAMLADEGGERTQLPWRQSDARPPHRVPAIAVGPAKAPPGVPEAAGRKFRGGDARPRPEGYQIRIEQGKEAPMVWVAGDDARGVLFGVGRLLRALRLEKGKATLPAAFAAASAPHYPLRGHQLGYR